MMTNELFKELRKQFVLDWKGIHGAAHWTRVRENGLRLAESTQARADIVELFAFLHDSMRVNDDFDPYHGTRAAHYAESLRGELFELDDEGLRLLMIACEGHSDGLMDADITVQTCWDADRLDLGRVGIRPKPERLCTEAAKDIEMIEWAYERSVKAKSRLIDNLNH